jgi:16S rRNA (guanine966-N2)-methyltransferase
MAGSKAAAGISAGRVVAGSARGIRLVGPGEGTRPLGDRVKQSLFAILEPSLRDRVFVDLYAGSGAAGIEALSRGADWAFFVERDHQAAGTIRDNLRATHLAGRATVVETAVSKWLAAAQQRELGEGPATIVFFDPPYDAPDELGRTLQGIEAAGPDGVLARDGWAIAKHFRKESPAPTRLLGSVRQERFGDTILTFYRWLDEGDA